MTTLDIASYIEGMKKRFSELEARMADSSIYAKPAEAKALSREHLKLTRLFADYDKWQSILKQREDNLAMLHEEKDQELKDLIQADIESINVEAVALEKAISRALLPPDPNEDRNSIVEIRPAAGGEEAALFASELYRMYTKYAESKKWKVELLDLSMSDLGGIKEAVFCVSGDDVFSRLKYESGVHRVQRIPRTEAGGRIHTSTITVAVLGEAEEVELDLRQEDLKFDVFRSSGPGGQCVNTTDSAVRVTHIPTGLSVASQQEKSQHRNKEIALRILRARLLERMQQEEAAKQAATKKAQVGTGDRSERIRTYNFPQNRVTDHRFGVNVYDLPRLLEGDLDSLFDQIIEIDCERKLAAAIAQ